MSQPYEVFSYDVSDEPAGQASLRSRGKFDDPARAIATARGVVDRELLDALGSCNSAAELLDRFRHFGEGALIFGEPKLSFNPHTYAKERAEALFAMPPG